MQRFARIQSWTLARIYGRLSEANQHEWRSGQDHARRHQVAGGVLSAANPNSLVRIGHRVLYRWVEANKVARKKTAPHHRVTAPFLYQEEKQVVEVVDTRQTVRRCRWRSGEAIEETVCPVTGTGCAIEAIRASPSGRWLVTQRISGQGEWGYDVFQTCPLARVAGVAEERGYILELPAFSEDESRLIGGFGQGFLGGWWAHPDDDIEDPPRGGLVTVGCLFVHRLPSHRVKRHELRVELPRGWLPEDPWAEWYGPRDIAPTADGVHLMPSWGVPVELEDPLPRIILLPTPHPSGKGLL
jgi:hypothetical protein